MEDPNYGPRLSWNLTCHGDLTIQIMEAKTPICTIEAELYMKIYFKNVVNLIKSKIMKSAINQSVTSSHFPFMVLALPINSYKQEYSLYCIGKYVA